VISAFLVDHTYVMLELMVQVVTTLSVVICNGCIVTKRQVIGENFSHK